MANLTITFGAHPRWWFTPLLSVVGWLMERGMMSETRALAVARWAGVHGLVIR